MKMKKWKLIVFLSLGLTLSACDDTNNNTDTKAQSEQIRPALVPPAPGEVGGLPDDRTPLNEGMVDPETIQGAGLIMEEYAIALEDGDYDRAYQYWYDNGKASGMAKAEFIESFSKYQDINSMIGRPTNGEAENYAIVPYQMYGRLSETQEPFNLFGNMTLIRENNKWMLLESGLKSQGMISEKPVDQSTDNSYIEAIPQLYRGHWAQTEAACNTPTETNIIIYPLIINYWESEAAISDISIANNTLKFSANFSGEGEEWKDDRSLTLENGNKTLVDDVGVKRIKCPEIP